MEQKIVSSSSVELFDTDVPVNSDEQYRLKTDSCDDELACTVYSDEMSSENVRNRRQATRQHQKQRCSSDRTTSKGVANDQEVVISKPHQSIARKTDMSSNKLIGRLRHLDNDSHLVCNNVNVCQPSHELSIAENISGCGNLFCCSKCGRQYTRLNNFIRHRELNCSVHCSTCKKPFEDLSALRAHRVTHRVSSADRKNSLPKLKKPAQYICSHCGRLFKTTATLNSHVMTHTGERPVSCRVAGCNKRFTQHSTRAFHERTHSDEMRHICAVCGRRFKHAIGVRLHMTVHTGLKPYQCSSCPMMFRRACDLQRHSRTHTAERPFSCPNCQKCFKAKKTLNCHILALHSDEIPWRCSVCNKGFKTSGNLHVHLRVHTGDKPYVCGLCGIRFSYSSSLKLHMHVHSGSD